MTVELTAGAGIPSDRELATMERLSDNLAGSGLFKDASSARAAFAKVMYGRDMGLSASAAMTGLHIVEGKPELSANLQAQLVNTYTGPDGERYRFRVREHDKERCAIEFQIRERGGEWESLGTSVYTMEDADTAGLTGKTRSGKPSMYTKHPRNMLWARAMSDGVNFFCPEVARGLRVYHEGEIGGEEHDLAAAPVAEAEVVEATVVEPLSDCIGAERAAEIEEQAKAAIRAELVSAQGFKLQLQALGVGGRSVKQSCAMLTPEQADAVEGLLADLEAATA